MGLERWGFGHIPRNMSSSPLKDAPCPGGDVTKYLVAINAVPIEEVLVVRPLRDLISGSMSAIPPHPLLSDFVPINATGCPRKEPIEEVDRKLTFRVKMSRLSSCAMTAGWAISVSLCSFLMSALGRIAQ
jgi:hypothetical protein